MRFALALVLATALVGSVVIATPGLADEEGLAVPVDAAELTASESLRQLFPEVVDSLNAPPSLPPPGSRYLDDRTALVNPPPEPPRQLSAADRDEIRQASSLEEGGELFEAAVAPDGTEGAQPSLLSSTTPLRDEDPQGEVRPVDLALVETADGYRPSNDLADTGFPSHGSGAVTLDEGRITISLRGADAAPATELGRSILVYPAVRPSVDLIAAPTTVGAELFTQLSDANAAETFVYDVTVPPGAELVQRGDAAEVVKDGEIVASIPAPTGEDAAGAPVEVEMTVDESSLVVSVPHRDTEASYPLLIDPGIAMIYGWFINPTQPFDGWGQFNNNPVSFSLQGHCNPALHGNNPPAAPPCPGTGLYVYAAGLHAYEGLSRAGYVYSVPHLTGANGITIDNPETTSYINSAFIDALVHNKRNDPQAEPHLLYGIWDPFAATYVDAGTSFVETPFAGGIVKTSSAAPPVQRAKQFRFELIHPAGSTFTFAYRSAYLGAVTFDIFDEDFPRIAVNRPVPLDWINDESPGARGTGTADAYDGEITADSTGAWGLGLTSFYFADGINPAPGPSCTGVNQPVNDPDGGGPQLRGPCPQFIRDLEFSWDSRDYPQGANIVGPVAVDAMGRTPNPGFDWGLLVDRSAPTLGFSGDLAPNSPQQPGEGGFQLGVRATDGNQATLAQWRSGVKKLEILVDDERVRYFERTRAQCNGGHASGSCGRNETVVLNPLDYEEGRHRITVIATDFLDHEAMRTWEVELEYGAPKIVRVESTHAKRKLDPDEVPPGIEPATQFEPRWISTETIETELFARDRGRGVDRFELRLPNGGPTQNANASCVDEPTGACPEYTGGTMSYTSSQLPEGDSTAPDGPADMTALAFDEEDNPSAPVSVPYKVDRTAPVLNEALIQGSTLFTTGCTLNNQEPPPAPADPPAGCSASKRLIWGNTYGLTVAATDTHATRTTSGVQKVQVTATQQTENFTPRTIFSHEQDCTAGNCPAAVTVPFDTRDFDRATAIEPRTVQQVGVKVTDGAGNATIEVFTVTIESAAATAPEGRTYGLENYFQYDSTESGLSGTHVNLATGNAVWHSTPMVNPGRGLSSVLNVTYNSFDSPLADLPPGLDTRFNGLEYDEAGLGMSVGLSGITRVNEPLGLTVGTACLPVPSPTINLTDPDGTVHQFQQKLLENGDGAEYHAPPGVHLHLRVYGTGDSNRFYAATRPDGATYFFDSCGVLRSVEDRNGNRLVYEYENQLVLTGTGNCAPVLPAVCEPRLVRVIDAAGTDQGGGDPDRPARTVSVAYYPRNAAAGSEDKISQITDHAGRRLTFEYTATGHLRQMTEASGAVPAGFADTAARAFVFGYDAPGGSQHRQLLSVTDPRGNVTKLTYNASVVGGTNDRSVLTTESRRGNVRDYGFLGALMDPGLSSFTVVTDARDKNWSYLIDSRDRLQVMSDPLDSQTQMGWDGDNNVVAVVEAAGTTDAATTTYAYNQNGLLTSQTDPLGRTTRLEYLNHAGMYRGDAGVLGVVPSVDTDDDGFVSDLVAITRPAGNRWSFTIEPDTANNGAATLNGNVVAQTDPTGETATATYNGDGTLKTETDEAGDSTSYCGYDRNGFAQQVFDPRSQVNDCAAIEADDHRWLYRYDEAGNLRQTVDPRGAAELPAGPIAPGHSPNGPFTTTLSYDELYRLVAERAPKDSEDGQFIERAYEYDKNDNQTMLTDGEGKQWRTCFTRMDRPGAEITPLGERTEYVYDTEEGVTRVTRPRGVIGTPGQDCVPGATPTSYTTEYALDAIGRPVVERRQSAQDPKDLVTSYAYDGRDNLLRVVDPNANDNASTATAITNTSNPALQRLVMNYDKADQLVTEVQDPDEANIRTEYRYDLNGNQRIVVSPRAFSEGPDAAAYAEITDYDRRDMPITHVDPMGDETSWTYTDDGNLATETSPNGNASGAGNDFTTVYTYNANDDVVERTIPFADDDYRLDDADPNWSVTYDRNPVGDPIEITDARGNSITNEFFDSGELQTTTRPSWWKLDSGNSSPMPNPGMRFAAQASGVGADTMVAPGGPVFVERPGAAAASASGGGGGSSQPVAPGDFGRVEAEPIPDMLPRSAPNGEPTEFRYDDEMRLERIFETVPGPDGGVFTRLIDYDADGQVTSKRWPFIPGNPIQHRFTYDANGNLKTLTDGEGKVRTYGYDEFDRVIEELAPGAEQSATEGTDNEQTKLLYDLNGNLTDRLTPRCLDDAVECGGGAARFAFEFDYDDVDRLIQEKNPAGDAWRYVYDDAGNLTGETSPRGVATATQGDFTTEIEYDRANRPAVITDPLGFETVVSYDANGNRIRVEEPGASTTGAESHPPRVTEMTYDGRDLPWQTTTGVGSDDERTVVTEYDPNGNLRRLVNPSGVAGRLPENPDTGINDEDAPVSNLRAATLNATVYEYNDEDLLLSTYLPWDAKGGTDANGVNQGGQNSRRYKQAREYDNRGRPESITFAYRITSEAGPEDDARADRVCYEHYETGWIKTATEPESVDVETGHCLGPEQTVSYSYDQRGLQTSWTGIREGGGSRTISRAFYPNGLLDTRHAQGTGSEDPRTYEYFYNPNRSLVSFIQRQPNPERKTVIMRDGAEREKVVNETWDDGDRDTLNRYDAAGNVVERFTDGDWTSGDGYSNGTVTSFEYDALERETKMHVGLTGGAVTRTTSTAYYPSGDVLRIERDLSGSEAVETEDEFDYLRDGRLAERRHITDGEADEKTETTSYAYDANGNRTRDERGTHLFNSRDQLVRWNPSKGPANAKDVVSYRLDGSGATVEKIDEDPSGSDVTYEYTADRLISSTTDPGEDPAYTTHYEYNDFGSITCAQVIADDPGCDAEGTATQPASTEYLYDGFERNTGAKVAGELAENTTYAYDGLDRRDLKTKGSQSFELSYVGTSELLAREKSASQVKRYDYDSLGRRQGQAIAANYRSYEKDANGSVIGLDSQAGAELGSYDYDPYGALDSDADDPEGELTAAARANPFRFEGFYYDSGVETYDMQARTYAPEIGRFLSQDRYAMASADLALQSDPLTQNRYAFAGGNPVSNVEWDGHIMYTGDSVAGDETAVPMGGDPFPVDNGPAAAPIGTLPAPSYASISAGVGTWTGPARAPEPPQRPASAPTPIGTGTAVATAAGGEDEGCGSIPVNCLPGVGGAFRAAGRLIDEGTAAVTDPWGTLEAAWYGAQPWHWDDVIESAVNSCEAFDLECLVYTAGSLAGPGKFRLASHAPDVDAPAAARAGEGPTSQILRQSPAQLQSKFKHAADFGVAGNYSKASAARFNSAINQHINRADVMRIRGNYRGSDAVHYLDPKTGLNVVSDPSGNFISGWRLSNQQQTNVLLHGGLGGG